MVAKRFINGLSDDIGHHLAHLVAYRFADLRSHIFQRLFNPACPMRCGPNVVPVSLAVLRQARLALAKTLVVLR